MKPPYSRVKRSPMIRLALLLSSALILPAMAQDASNPPEQEPPAQSQSGTSSDIDFGEVPQDAETQATEDALFDTEPAQDPATQETEDELFQNEPAANPQSEAAEDPVIDEDPAPDPETQDASSADAPQVDAPSAPQLEQGDPGDPSQLPPQADQPATAEELDSLFGLPEGEDQESFTSVIPGEAVELRGLNKITAETTDMTLEFNQPVQFGTLTIVARYCSKRPPEFIPETFVFLEIYDHRTPESRAIDVEVGRGERQKIFSGWMLGSSPGLHGLEHPIFDVWAVDCDLPPQPEPVFPTTASDALSSDSADSASAPDSEAPADDPA